MEEFSIEQHHDIDFKKVETYIKKYVQELQMHFDISDDELSKILANILTDIKSKNPSRSWWDVIKSKL